MKEFAFCEVTEFYLSVISCSPISTNSCLTSGFEKRSFVLSLDFDCAASASNVFQAVLMRQLPKGSYLLRQ